MEGRYHVKAIFTELNEELGLSMIVGELEIQETEMGKINGIATTTAEMLGQVRGKKISYMLGTDHSILAKIQGENEQNLKKIDDHAISKFEKAVGLLEEVKSLLSGYAISSRVDELVADVKGLKEIVENNLSKNIVICIDCDAKLNEDVALVVRKEPKTFKCIDCHLKSI